MLPLVTEHAAVQPLLGEPGLLTIDVGTAEQYAEGHLPGAVHLEFAALLRKVGPVGGLLPGLETLATLLGAHGIGPGRHVLAYDRDGGGRAARLIWTLHALGFEQASLLDGGVQAWCADGGTLDTRVVTPQPLVLAAPATPRCHIALDEVLAGLGDPGRVVVDSRSPQEFSGEDRRALRGGHIPGAVNWNWTRAQDDSRQRRLRPVAALQDELSALGVSADREVVLYCQTHHRSSHSYVVLRHLGYPRLRGYAGAWSEWGNLEHTPVVQGA